VPERGLRAPLRRAGFRRLALSYAVNELGDWLGIVALSVLVFDQTGSALASAALFLGTGFVPALLTPLLVVRAERGRARVTLPLIYCGETVVFAALAVSAAHFSLPVVVALAALDGVLALTARSLTRAVAASMLEPSGELRAGNAILNVAFTGGAAIGPALGGLLVAGSGVQTALLLDAASFFLVALILFTGGPLPKAEPEPGRFRQRLAAGISYISDRPLLRRLILAQAVAFLFFAAVIPVEVIYAKDTLDAGDSGYGALLASWGAGMVIGGIAFALLRRAPLGYLLLVSTITIGAAYLGMAAAPSLAVACGAAAVGGTGNGVQWVALISAVQELTSERMQARVVSVVESAGAVMPGIGYLVGGVVAAAYDPRAAFAVAGVGVLAVVAVSAPLVGRLWARRPNAIRLRILDSGNDGAVELHPRGFVHPRDGSASPRAGRRERGRMEDEHRPLQAPGSTE
jgi:MFS family permease